MGFFETFPSDLIHKLLGITDSETLLQNVLLASKQTKIYSEIALLSRQSIEDVPFQEAMLISLVNNITTFKKYHKNIHPDLLKALTTALDETAKKNPFLNYFHHWMIYQLLIILKNPESVNEISPLLRKKLDTEISSQTDSALSQEQLTQQSISECIEELNDYSYTQQTLDALTVLSFHKDLWSAEHLSKLIRALYNNEKQVICLILVRLAPILSDEQYCLFLKQLITKLDDPYTSQPIASKTLKLLIVSKPSDQQCILLLSELLINLLYSKSSFVSSEISKILALLVPILNDKQRAHLVSEFMRIADESNWLNAIPSETLSLFLSLLSDTDRIHLVSKSMKKFDGETYDRLSNVQRSTLKILQSLVPLLSNTQCMQLWSEYMLELDSKDKMMQNQLIEFFFMPLASRLGNKLSNTQRSELLSKLFIKLHDTDTNIRISVYEALASRFAMSLFNDPKDAKDADELLKKLIMDCNDKNPVIREIVYQVLNSLAPILMRTLNDQLWTELFAKLSIYLDYQKFDQPPLAIFNPLNSLSSKLDNSQATMFVQKLMEKLDKLREYQQEKDAVVVCKSLASVLLRLSDFSQRSEALCTLAKKTIQRGFVRTEACKAIVLLLPKLKNADLVPLLHTLAESYYSEEATLLLKQCIYELDKSKIPDEPQIKLLQTKIMPKLFSSYKFEYTPALDVLSMPQMLSCFDSVIERGDDDNNNEAISILNDMITLSAALNNKALPSVEPDNAKKFLKQ